jgi:tyrosyl-tRNA synthetase
MKLSEELVWRGFVNQTTIQNLAELDKKKRTFYHGFDASADSQTIGNLAAMMFDMVFMRHGYKAILLAGGATSLIGDPGGKDSERALKSEADVRRNVEGARAELERIFKGQKFTLVNNLDWTKNMTVLDFLRDIGKHFGMTDLVQRDYIATRIGEGGAGISYTEFSYTLLQGMDYLHLYDKYGATLQLGGSDQWGNCLSGVDLIRKTRGATVDVMTLPLVINKATGKKFGKSEEGAVWLNPNKTSVYKFYQFWLNLDDDGVIDYMKIYTTLDKKQIDAIAHEHAKAPQARQAQKRLAQEVTKIVHGKKALATVEKVTAVLFGDRKVSSLSRAELDMLANEIPTAQVKHHLVDILVQTGVATGKGQARKLIESGGVQVNGVKAVGDEVITKTALIKKGKNTFILVR